MTDEVLVEIGWELLEELDGFFETRLSTSGLDLKVAFEKALVELRGYKASTDTFDWALVARLSRELMALVAKAQVTAGLAGETDIACLQAADDVRRKHRELCAALKEMT